MKRPEAPPPPPQSPRRTAAASAAKAPEDTLEAANNTVKRAPSKPAKSAKASAASQAAKSKPELPRGRSRAKLPAEQAAAEAKASLKQARRERKKSERTERRRFTAASRRRRLLIGGSLGSVILVAAASIAVAYSPLMAVRTISVSGASSIDPSAVAAALNAQIGTPLPLVSESAVQSSLEAFPGIQSFSLESVPPSTLIVRIIERVPVGFFETANGFDTVDASGVVIGSAAEPPAGVAQLEVADGTQSRAFASLGRVLLALPPELRAQILRASASSPSDLRLELASGQSVVWGDGRDTALKLRALQALLIASPGAGEIDVSAPTSPVTR